MYARKAVDELRSSRVTVQVSRREKEILKLNAKRKGMDLSDYIRLICIYEPYNELLGGK